jgi:WD40 repeat protein
MTSDAGLAVAADSRGRVAVWKLGDTPQRDSLVFDTTLGSAVRHLALSDDGRWLVATRANGQGGWWLPVDKGATKTPLDFAFEAQAVTFTPDSSRFVAVGAQLQLWDTRTWQSVASTKRSHAPATDVVLNDDGRLVLMSEHSVALFRPQDSEPFATLLLGSQLAAGTWSDASGHHQSYGREDWQLAACRVGHRVVPFGGCPAAALQSQLDQFWATKP